MAAMEELGPFLDATATTYNDAMRRWKEQGGKIIGYVCTSVPEEMILAAGMLPYRIRAPESRETSEADRYTTYLNCSYCRHVIDEALRGRYDFLDGFVGTNGCDQMRRVCDVFRSVVFRERAREGMFFVDFVAAPRVPSDELSLRYYGEELERLRQNLRKSFGAEITAETLRRAIRETNRSRRMLRQLYELRKSDQPPVTGAETLGITVASTCMPKEEFNSCLEALLGALEGRAADPEHRKRLFLYGSELDDPEWVKVIEEQGGLVVADGLCFGARMFWDLVDESISMEPSEALARRYYERWSCPRVMDPDGRQDRLKEIVRQWRVDGIVGERMVFCQLWGAERVITDIEARQEGIPTLWLEREYMRGGLGQMRTRVQAFLESLE
jgi:benzoyl-CoA reductase/2-hydroxyglutaryl-CoA dehydratase subunit BcrC/BadD/HgdB